VIVFSLTVVNCCTSSQSKEESIAYRIFYTVPCVGVETQRHTHVYPSAGVFEDFPQLMNNQGKGDCDTRRPRFSAKKSSRRDKSYPCNYYARGKMT